MNAEAGIVAGLSPSLLQRTRWLAGLVVAVLLFGWVNLSVGAEHLSPYQVWQALQVTGPNYANYLVEARLSRTLLAISTGAALAVSGTLLQNLTRNPLAEPGLLGINAGAAASLVTAGLVLGSLPTGAFWLALPGALFVAILVGLQGTYRQHDPSHLLLLGAALNAVLFAYVQAITLTHPALFANYRFWVVGSINGHTLDDAQRLFGWIAVGLGMSFLLPRLLHILQMGDGVTKALGLNAGCLRLVVLSGSALLAAITTAAVGPISFVGLAVPLLTKKIAGHHLYWQLAIAMVMGPLMMILADLLARLLLSPSEIMTGILTALLGAPFLLVALRINPRSV
ncbi:MULTISPECIES: FecCD family ABC transporter permease [unclassified Halomonas]|uniref:FecCD family ABC transporter permease n=1 Tax=unclassified Halomonas TaxID=2609666 RepID=UPI00099090C0|nr:MULTISPECIES: iron ABC transporter permease [unclassified Halomonas]AQU84198.1 iron ABC transporter permease [Halomonas sp. 'Soap Lake \